jgi:hypothetical protein
MWKRRRKLNVAALVLLTLLSLTSMNHHLLSVLAQEEGGGLVVSPTSLTFTAHVGGSAPPAQHVSVSSSSSNPLNFTVDTSSTATWLHASPTSGTTPATISVSVNPSGLAVGTYTGSVRISQPNVEESSRYVSVTLNITTTTASLVVSPTTLSFSYQQGGAPPSSQNLSVRSSTGSAVGFTANVTSGGSWLSLNPTSGTTPANVAVSVNPSGLSPGTHMVSISVSSSIGSATVSVIFTVTSAQMLVVNPTVLGFSYQQGGTVPSPQTFSVKSSTGSAVAFSTTANSGGWLSASPANGTTPAMVTVSVNPSGLTVGMHNSSVTLTSSIGSATVTVTLNVTAAPTMTVAPNTLAFGFQQGGSLPASQSLSVSSTTPGVSFTAVATTSSGGSWLIGSGSGVTPSTLTVSVNPGILAVGTYNGSIAISSSIGSVTVPVTLTITTATGGGGSFVLLAWSELGMHCMDGHDYSVMGLLPPFNTIYAKLLTIGTTPTEVTSGVTLTYTAFRDASGSINTTSYGTSTVHQKTNFWSYARLLYLLSPSPDVGLLNNPVQSLTPNPMKYGGGMILDPNLNVWKAEAIPTSPYDDNFAAAPYSMVKITAMDSTGAVIATATIVVPVSDDIGCKNCHAPNTNPAAMPSGGWINNPSYTADQNTKLNILKKHDDLSPIPASVLSAVQAEGFNYQSSLYQTALNGGALGNPVVCTTCHANNVFVAGGLKSGVPGVNPMTADIHTRHASVTLPGSTTTLDNMTGNTGMTSGCYQCHPGVITQCQRGVMTGTIPGSTPATCYTCHGNLSRVGMASRSGWLSVPSCQMCHQNGTTYTTTFTTTDIGPNGIQRTSTDATFASNPDTPSTGFSLYRFSTGHGGVNCTGCHGSQHAEYPTNQPNDQVYSTNLQGYIGRITECAVCHGTGFATSPNGGPHGMHTVGSAWVSAHPNYVNANGTATCAYCHGADFRGTSLSMLMTTKTLAGHTFQQYHQMNCYDCHNGPGGG